ncbi:MAG: uroporphyrinogen-III synthase [Rickettsiales bacterium]|jgi:uroporphyrinogen-III synthase|nr:uroporphyrinogen-III synthase [Rickettsiales bacterium]
MKILITRPIDEAIILAKELTNFGHHPVINPLLEIELFQNINFKNFDKYEAIIITSKNAIKAIVNADKKLKLFVIGEHSTEFARSLGFINSIYAGANIEELKNFIQPYSNLLYLSGVDISDDLSSLNKKITRLEVYKAKIIESASNEFIKFIQSDNLKLCLFFSKRTAQIFLNHIKKYKLESYCDRIISLSLSDNINNSLKGLNLHSYYVSKDPSLKSIMNSIDKICK